MQPIFPKLNRCSINIILSKVTKPTARVGLDPRCLDYGCDARPKAALFQGLHLSKFKTKTQLHWYVYGWAYVL